VLLDTPEDQVRSAEKEIRDRLKQDKARVRGPMVFEDGRYTLVSSVLRSGNKAPDREVIATGQAPVLEGNRLALSFDLDPEHASLLMQSFQMNTPDISLVFDMTFNGLSEAYDADITIDWSEVKNSKGFSAGGTGYYISADVGSLSAGAMTLR